MAYSSIVPFKLELSHDILDDLRLVRNANKQKQKTMGFMTNDAEL